MFETEPVRAAAALQPRLSQNAALQAQAGRPTRPVPGPPTVRRRLRLRLLSVPVPFHVTSTKVTFYSGYLDSEPST